jgi:tRNA nucleotidyltransferase (CCA-adding enzyme)
VDAGILIGCKAQALFEGTLTRSKADMKTYLVGGAVRDQLLGLEVKERDWVVVGASPEHLLSLGFRAVGRDFPVFLHPETHEEYALARTERKTGPGYHGFEFHASPGVSLEADLFRRDLTINAMARDEFGQLIDPYGGLSDLEARRLRHVSPAFVEDPVRILRLARFAARFDPLGFTVAEETRSLMKQMVRAGEVDALVPERVFQELQKALAEPSPAVFFEVLRDCGALKRLFPEIDALFGVPQDPTHHPEMDTGLHTLLVLKRAAELTSDPVIRFAALVHDLGKGATDPALWPRHPDHEVLGEAVLEALSLRLRLPSVYLKLAQKVVLYHGSVHRAFSLTPPQLVQLLEALGLFKQPEGLSGVILACLADARGRPGFESVSYPQGERLSRALDAARGVSTASLLSQGLSGAALGAALKSLRIEAVATVIAADGEPSA